MKALLKSLIWLPVMQMSSGAVLKDSEVDTDAGEIVTISETKEPDPLALDRSGQSLLGISAEELLAPLQEIYNVKIGHSEEGATTAGIGNDTVVMMFGNTKNLTSVQVWGSWTDANTADFGRTIGHVRNALGLDEEWNKTWLIPALTKVDDGFRITGSSGDKKVELQTFAFKGAPVVILDIQRN